MTLKSGIKKAINQHSKRYNAVKVWTINFEEDSELCGTYDGWLTIEVSVKRKKRNIKKATQ